MRYIITAILFLMLSNFSARAQNDLDVKRIVREQFEAAKGVNNHIANQAITASSTVIKLSLITGAAVISFGWVGYRRFKSKKKYSTAKLKENIKSIRAEKISYSMDPQLKLIRKKLMETVPGVELGYETIHSSAKRLNISQDEIVIAARLNMYIQNNIGESIA